MLLSAGFECHSTWRPTDLLTSHSTFQQMFCLCVTGLFLLFENTLLVTSLQDLKGLPHPPGSPVGSSTWLGPRGMCP